METDTMREVGEIVQKMLAIGWDSKMKKHDGTSIVVSFTKAELCELLISIEEQHHHQLQKAREEERERIATELDRYAHESHSPTINIKHLMEKLVPDHPTN